MRDPKAVLRAALRAVVIPDDLRADASPIIATTITQHPAFLAATSIAAFVGVRNEPDTTAILTAALANHKHLFVPRVADRTRLAWHRIHDLHSFTTNPYGLLEPSPSLPAQFDLENIDLALVPGVAFSSTGARLGHGRGYYDRALASAPSITRIGLTLARFVDPPEGQIPTTTTDVFMQAVVSERGLTTCPAIR